MQHAPARFGLARALSPLVAHAVVVCGLVCVAALAVRSTDWRTFGGSCEPNFYAFQYGATALNERD
jgi:hypothetical protein